MNLQLIYALFVGLGPTKKHVWTIVIAILATLTVVSLGTLAVIFIRRKLKKSKQNNDPQNSRAPSRSFSTFGTSSFQYPFSKPKSEAQKRSFRQGKNKQIRVKH